MLIVINLTTSIFLATDPTQTVTDILSGQSRYKLQEVGGLERRDGRLEVQEIRRLAHRSEVGGQRSDVRYQAKKELILIFKRVFDKIDRIIRIEWPLFIKSVLDFFWQGLILLFESPAELVIIYFFNHFKPSSAVLNLGEI